MQSAKEIITKLTTDIGINECDIKDDTCYDDIFQKGSLGLAESYIQSKWDLTSTLTLDELFNRIGKTNLGQNLAAQSLFLKLWLLLQWLWSNLIWLWTPSQQLSKVVADSHYNLDSRLYDLMLSKDKMYSCAYFTTSDMNLHDAQIAKLDLIAKKLNLQPGMTILDIGCGWGFACHYFHTKYGVNIHGITISEKQYEYAVENYGNEHVKFYLDDYRCLPNLIPKQSCDASYSIGMFEHVTNKHYRQFMSICHKLLKPNGLFLLHTIAANTTKNVNDPFLEKYIFPNSMLPSMADISISSEHLFIIEDVHNFGCHYDRTLMCWYHNFITNSDKLSFLSPEFKRMWTYYLLSCAGTFRSKGCQLYQVVLSKERYSHYERPK